MAVDYSYYYFAPEALTEASSTSSATSSTQSSSSATDTKQQPVLQKLPVLSLQSSMFIDLDSEEWDDNLGRWIAGTRRVASAKAKLQSSATTVAVDGALKE